MGTWKTLGATEAVGMGKGVTAGEAIGADGIGVGADFGAGRNSGCRIHPPASAVQMLRPMEIVQPRRTAQPIHAA